MYDSEISILQRKAAANKSHGNSINLSAKRGSVKSVDGKVCV